MNQRTRSRLDRLEAEFCELTISPLVIVSQRDDGRCLAQGQEWPSLGAVEKAYPKALLIVGQEPAQMAS
jgi:hypothetical protein